MYRTVDGLKLTLYTTAAHPYTLVHLDNNAEAVTLVVPVGVSWDFPPSLRHLAYTIVLEPCDRFPTVRDAYEYGRDVMGVEDPEKDFIVIEEVDGY